MSDARSESMDVYIYPSRAKFVKTRKKYTSIPRDSFSARVKDTHVCEHTYTHAQTQAFTHIHTYAKEINIISAGIAGYPVSLLLKEPIYFQMT